MEDASNGGKLEVGIQAHVMIIIKTWEVKGKEGNGKRQQQASIIIIMVP